MAFSPSPPRGCLLRGRGSPERRIPCFEARKFSGSPDRHPEKAIDRLAHSNRPTETAGHADAVDDFRLKSKDCVMRAHRRRELHFMGTDPRDGLRQRCRVSFHDVAG